MAPAPTDTSPAAIADALRELAAGWESATEVLLRKAYGQARSYVTHLPGATPPYIMVLDLARTLIVWDRWEGGFGGFGAGKRIDLPTLHERPADFALLRDIWERPAARDPLSPAPSPSPRPPIASPAPRARWWPATWRPWPSSARCKRWGAIATPPPRPRGDGCGAGPIPRNGHAPTQGLHDARWPRPPDVRDCRGDRFLRDPPPGPRRTAR